MSSTSIGQLAPQIGPLANPLVDLPRELWTHAVLPFLAFRDIRSLGAVNKQFRWCSINDDFWLLALDQKGREKTRTPLQAGQRPPSAWWVFLQYPALRNLPECIPVFPRVEGVEIPSRVEEVDVEGVPVAPDQAPHGMGRTRSRPLRTAKHLYMVECAKTQQVIKQRVLEALDEARNTVGLFRYLTGEQQREQNRRIAAALVATTGVAGPSFLDNPAIQTLLVTERISIEDLTLAPDRRDCLALQIPIVWKMLVESPHEGAVDHVLPMAPAPQPPAPNAQPNPGPQPNPPLPVAAPRPYILQLGTACSALYKWLTEGLGIELRLIPLDLLRQMDAMLGYPGPDMARTRMVFSESFLGMLQIPAMLRLLEDPSGFLLGSSDEDEAVDRGQVLDALLVYWLDPWRRLASMEIDEGPDLWQARGRSGPDDSILGALLRDGVLIPRIHRRSTCVGRWCRLGSPQPQYANQPEHNYLPKAWQACSLPLPQWEIVLCLPPTRDTPARILSEQEQNVIAPWRENEFGRRAAYKAYRSGDMSLAQYLALEEGDLRLLETPCGMALTTTGGRPTGPRCLLHQEGEIPRALDQSLLLRLD